MISSSMDAIPITQIIKGYTNNPEVNFYGKFLWLVNQLNPTPLEIFLENLFANNTTPKLSYTAKILKEWETGCMVTQAILMTSFFGINFEKKDHPRLITIKEEAVFAIPEVKRIIVSKEPLVRAGIRQSCKLDEDHWTVYSFRIMAGQKGNLFNVHAFTLLQAIIEGKLIYKIYQSYWDQYTFEEDLERDEEIGRDDLFVMLNQLLELIVSERWCSDELFKRFFKAIPPPPPADGKMVNPRKLQIRYGDVSRADLRRVEIEYAMALPLKTEIEFEKGSS